MIYPKIPTLFDRGPDFKVLPDKLRHPEFDLIKNWHITEKVDGTNIRVTYRLRPGFLHGEVSFRGRTDAAQISPFLLNMLEGMFRPEAFAEAFAGREGIESVTLFGEGYGARIQKGGGNYRADTSFRLFDVVVQKERDWWMNWSEIEDIAQKLDIKTVPALSHIDTINAAHFFAQEAAVFTEGATTGGMKSIVAAEENNGLEIMAEGVVARTEPLLFMRNGQPLRWKLKTSDFK